MPDPRGYVSALYNSILSRDILGRHNVRNAQRFIDAAYVIMQQFAREIAYEALAARTGVFSIQQPVSCASALTAECWPLTAEY